MIQRSGPQIGTKQRLVKAIDHRFSWEIREDLGNDGDGDGDGDGDMMVI